MNRAEFLRAVADVVDAVDEHTFLDDTDLREVLAADDDESVLDAAKRACSAGQAAFDESKVYKDHATKLARLLGVNAGGDVVEAVRGLVGDKDKLLLARSRVLELEKQVADLLAGSALVVEDKAVGDGDVVQIIKPDWEAVRKALCARGDGETTLAAAERNRDRIIDLAREIDEYDRQVAKAMQPIVVAPGKAVDGIHKLWMEVNALKSQLAATQEQLDLKGTRP